MALETDSDPFDQRQQLTLAAEALGWKVIDWAQDIPIVRDENGESFQWLPHIDDCESRRLQIRLGIHLSYNPHEKTMCVSCPLWDVEDLTLDCEETDALEMARYMVVLFAALSTGVEISSLDAAQGLLGY